jgi:hypothetical protein
VSGDTDGFRRVLHEWARRQLAEKSWHAGPFEVVSVQLEHQDAVCWSEVTREDALTDVRIEFRHDGASCELPGYMAGERCKDTMWSPMESHNTVAMINELLAI